MVKSDERIHQGSLPHAVSTQQSQDMPLSECQRKSLQHIGVSIIGVDVVDL
jgi:hypothetical protein